MIALDSIDMNVTLHGLFLLRLPSGSILVCKTIQIQDANSHFHSQDFHGLDTMFVLRYHRFPDLLVSYEECYSDIFHRIDDRSKRCYPTD